LPTCFGTCDVQRRELLGNSSASGPCSASAPQAPATAERWLELLLQKQGARQSLPQQAAFQRWQVKVHPGRRLQRRHLRSVRRLLEQWRDLWLWSGVWQLLQWQARLPLVPSWHLHLQANGRRSSAVMKLDKCMPEDRSRTQFRSHVCRLAPSADPPETPHSQ
jgi:hypothetical protein